MQNGCFVDLNESKHIKCQEFAKQQALKSYEYHCDWHWDKTHTSQFIFQDYESEEAKS